MDFVVEQAKLLAVIFHINVLQWALADLTLELLPDVRVDLLRLFAMALTCKPLLDATDADMAH